MLFESSAFRRVAVAQHVLMNQGMLERQSMC